MPCPFAPIIAAPGPEREDRLVTEELHFPASNAARATPLKKWEWCPERCCRAFWGL